uniref:FAD-binding domain-containing protein n=1 Tax=Kalanchoe fedtschenkoi TaxID=63787 RepID=A0A7N0VJK0_KALFE
MRKPKAVVVGGSIAGICCVHALTSEIGAGLGLEPLSCSIINSWLGQPGAIHSATAPLLVEQASRNLATDIEKGESWTLARDESYNFRAAYWPELHGLLYEAIPGNVVLWGHLFVSFNSRVLKTGDEVEVSADLLVAADGCLSPIRQHILPDVKLRYSGYCALRGVLDCSDKEESETYLGIRKAYPELGQCLYFDLGLNSHLVLCELTRKRINWGSSVTTKVKGEAFQNMCKEAEKTWIPEMARVMKETKEPFIDVIYDCDPLERIVWNNVVLVGDAAHPTTPHGLRGTNMSIVDAAVLGKCLAKWGSGKLQCALEEYQSVRAPVTSKQVLHSRRLGRIKQGLSLPDRDPFDPRTASKENCKDLEQKGMPFFVGAPLEPN